MKLVSRSALGWPPSAAPIQSTTRGVKIHYLGTSFKASSHSDCTVHVKQVRASHLANTAENYSDIAYNFLVCKHGYVYEGRGYGKRTGANGNQDLNRAHYAVCALLGSSGDTEPTGEMVQAIREVVYGLREHGAGNEIKGHRDGYATSCPGDALYALVKSGKLEPILAKPQPAVKYEPFPGPGFFRDGRKSPVIKAMRARLIAEGCSRYKSTSNPDVWGSGDKASYAAWQKKLKYAGSDADGIPGKTSWDKLKVPNS